MSPEGLRSQREAASSRCATSSRRHCSSSARRLINADASSWVGVAFGGRAEAAAAQGVELAAEEARTAAAALGRLTGRIDVEDILGEIFATFCIGK